MATRTITGTIKRPDGVPWAGATVKFRPVDDTYTASPTETFPIETVYATANASGTITVTLVSGLSVEHEVTLPDGETFRIIVPNGTAITLEELRAAYDVTVPIPAANLEDVVNNIINTSEDFEAIVEAAAIAHAAGLIVQEGDTTVVGAAGTLDFDASQFNITESPAGEANISLVASGYTDEQAQDAIGTILADTTSVDLSYNDATPSISAAVIYGGSGGDNGTAGTAARSDHAHTHSHTNVKSLNFEFGDLSGAGSALTTAERRAISIPVGWGTCTITRWRLLADVSTTTTMDIWKDSYANYPPTNADSITASAKPALSAAIKNESTTLTGWTTTFTGGDILIAEIEANNNAEWLLLCLEFTISED